MTELINNNLNLRQEVFYLDFMKEFSENTNLEIYDDLEKKYRWFKVIFPGIENFDYRNYDSDREYFDYLKVKGQISVDGILYKSRFSKIRRFLWISIWIFVIYKLFFLSFLADYVLFIFVLSGYARIYQTGAWEDKSLKINEVGCEVNKTTIIKWNEISNIIIIRYLMDKEANFIACAYIVSHDGILYKYDFSAFPFGDTIKKALLPVYIEYFREKSEKSG